MNGTSVRLFPQSEGFAEPVVVTLSPPAGSVGPGPTDTDLRTVLPVDKREPYMPPTYLPPYAGPVLPPAMPNAAGGFDHIPVDAPQFLSQHLYGGVRFTLDAWEPYFGRPIDWWHARELPQIELVPLVQWDNAHSGPGFIETGIRRAASGAERLFALNFDVISHETGHAILFAEAGVPTPERVTAGYLAFQESFSDLVALITSLHFPEVVDRLLTQTGGNLYVLNLVARLGELSPVEQIRVADNRTTIDDVADMRLTADGSWIDPSGEGRTQHHIGQALTGAVFDVLVDLYQDNLVRAGVLPGALDARGWDEARVERSFAELEVRTADALATHGPAFAMALAQARDDVGLTMARAMAALEPNNLTLDRVAARMLQAAAALDIDRLQTAFLENFLERGIDPRPLLGREAMASRRWGRASYAERRQLLAHGARERMEERETAAGYGAARRLMPHTDRTLE